MHILLRCQLKFQRILLNIRTHLPGLIINSLCHLVSAGHGDGRFALRHTGPVHIGHWRCDGQRPLASVHLHPEVTVEPPAGI